MADKPLCGVIFDICANPHFVVDCPNCPYKPGDVTSSPIIEEGFLKDAHQERIAGGFNFATVSAHLFYLNVMEGVIESMLEKEPKHLCCEKCKREYELTIEDNKSAFKKRGLNYLLTTV